MKKGGVDPFRNFREDVAAALEHCQESFDFGEASFSIKRHHSMSLQKILDHDDYGSWGEFEEGQFAGLSEEDLFDELASFRGVEWAERVTTWKSPTDVPAVVLVVSPEWTAIGDGRGRVNYAVGRGWKSLPVIGLKTPGKGVSIDEDRIVSFEG